MIQTRSMDHVDLDLGAGRLVRVGLIRDADGTPERLILVPAWKDGGAADHRHRLDLPASVLPQLRTALDELGADTEEGS